MSHFASLFLLAISVQHHAIDAAASIEQHIARTIERAVDNRRGDTGQATTEYALVLLAAALVALLVIAWATAGGGAARIARLFNSVIDSVIERV